MEVWIIERKYQYIEETYEGSQITGADVKLFIFTNKEKALAFAWKEAQEYSRKININSNFEYNNEGLYLYYRNEDLPELELSMKSDIFNSDNEQALVISTSF